MKPTPPYVEVRFNTQNREEGVLVQIPKRVATALQNLDPGEEADIVESILGHYKRRKEKRDAVTLKPIKLHIKAERKFLPELDELPGTFLERLIQKERASDDRSINADVLQLVRNAHIFGGLNSVIAPLLRQAVLLAVDDGDGDFFKSLGRAIENLSFREGEAKIGTAIEGFLLDHWITQNQPAVNLCCFTDQAIADFSRALGVALTLDAVRKTRQRLGLRPLRSRLVKIVEMKGSRIILR